MQTEQPGSVLELPNESRTLIVGTSGSGKSTLAEMLVSNHSLSNPTCQNLYIDSKPRFRAEYELWGVGTKVTRRYSKWAKDFGQAIPGSYVLPLQDVDKELDAALALGATNIIAQSTSQAQWPLLMRAAQHFYETANGKVERLVYVNELSDFFEVQKIGGIFWLIARSGREKKVGIIAETQRPVYIPKVLLTEMKRLYMFELDYEKDMQHLYEMGLPQSVKNITHEYTFFFWDKKLKTSAPSNNYYRLSL